MEPGSDAVVRRGRRLVLALVLLALMVGSGAVWWAAGHSDPFHRDGGAATRESVEADLAKMPTTAALLPRMRRAFAGAAFKARITGPEVQPFTYIASPSRPRARRAVRVESASTEGDQVATLLAVDKQLCFDEEFRPSVAQVVFGSYGTVDFDPEPWSCSPGGFGLNRLVTWGYLRVEPRGRVNSLVFGDDWERPEVVDLDGQALLHVRANGLTEHGVLSPERPPYDVWLGPDYLPVRMQSQGIVWEFAYPDDIDEQLSLPAASETGSYGWTQGPGSAAVRGCISFGECPEGEGGLVWGDGREQARRRGAVGAAP